MAINKKLHKMQPEVIKVESMELIHTFQLPREWSKIDILLREVIYENRDKQES